jgi:23S rRNA (guanosine2251-2'-O)-methyltransferase
MERFTRTSTSTDQVIWGIHPIMEAIKAGKTIDRILLRKQLKGDMVSELVQLAKEHSIHRQYVPEVKLDKITRKNHQGVIAYISPIDFHDLGEIAAMAFDQGRSPRFVALDGVTDVRNIGAIARTAECAGVDALILPAKGSAQINADAIKVSAGALMRIPVCKVPHFIRSLEELKASGVQIVSCTEKSDSTIFEADLSGPLCFVMGSEDMGIQPSILDMSDACVGIPMRGKTASLNVSVSAGIALFEMIRQIELSEK